MSSSLIKKISLVGKGGISIAEIPKSTEEDKEMLAAGLMAAMLAFSKEVHQRDLKSLSFHDHTVSFIMVEDFFIVVEINSTATGELVDEILRQIYIKANEKLNGLMTTTLPQNIAEELLEELFSKDWISATLDNLGFIKPFADCEILNFDLVKSNGVFDFVNTANKEHFAPISEFLVRGYSMDTSNRDFITAFIPIEHPNKVSNFVVARLDSEHIEVCLLNVDNSLEQTLFKLSPFIDREIRKYLSKNPDVELREIMETLKDTHDIVDNKIKDEDEISFRFLEKNMKKKLDNILFSVVTGERIIVTGDRLTVKIFTHSLLIFAQHLATDFVDWIVEDTKIGYGITGMSKNKYKEIEESIDGIYTLVDLDSGKVHGGQSNKYLKKLLSESKKIKLNEAIINIKEKMLEIVTTAIKVTSFVFLEKDEAVSKLKQLKKDVDDDKFKIIMELATRRNPWLGNMIQEINLAIKGAEDYFANF